jgi:hypothetical protein
MVNRKAILLIVGIAVAILVSLSTGLFGMAL